MNIWYILFWHFCVSLQVLKFLQYIFQKFTPFEKSFQNFDSFRKNFIKLWHFLQKYFSKFWLICEKIQNTRIISWSRFFTMFRSFFEDFSLHISWFQCIFAADFRDFSAHICMHILEFSAYFLCYTIYLSKGWRGFVFRKRVNDINVKNGQNIFNCETAFPWSPFGWHPSVTICLKLQ